MKPSPAPCNAGWLCEVCCPMSKRTLFFLPALCAGALAFGAVSAPAEDAAGKPDYVQKRLDEIKTVTGASDEQLAKIRAVLEEEKKKKQELGSLTGGEKKAKMKELRAATKASIDAVLTDEQRAKMNEAKGKKEGKDGGKSEKKDGKIEDKKKKDSQSEGS